MFGTYEGKFKQSLSQSLKVKSKVWLFTIPLYLDKCISKTNCNTKEL
jgi:hypothetical protein